MDGRVKTSLDRVTDDARSRHISHYFFNFFNKLTARNGVQFHVRLVEWRAIHLYKELSMTGRDSDVSSSWAIIEENLPGFERFSRNDNSTKLLASAYGSNILETMQCASRYVFGSGLIADLEGEIRNNTCILTDLLWITSESINPIGRKRVDFGNAAIAKFISSHVHNRFCIQFGLQREEQECSQKTSFQKKGANASSIRETRTRMESLLN